MVSGTTQSMISRVIGKQKRPEDVGALSVTNNDFNGKKAKIL